MTNQVFLNYFDNYNADEIQKVIEEAISKLNLDELFAPKSKVLIKACLPYDVTQDMAETTNPAVVMATVNALTKKGIKCIVADSPYGKLNETNLEKVYINTGMLEVANLTTCKLNHNMSTFNLQIPEGLATKSVTLLSVINEVDAIINIGKLKLDQNLGFCGVTSNLFGLIPGEMKTVVLNRMQTQEDYNNYCLDLFSKLNDKIVLNILDGIVSLEANKTPRMLYCLGLSKDALSLDAAALDIVGIKYENTILKSAEEREMFNKNKSYKLIKEEIERFKLEDFALVEVGLDNRLNPNKSEQKRYFRTHQDRVKISQNKCKGCGICAKICPTNAITMKYDKNGELYAEVNYEKCIFCNKCVTACPYSVVEKVSPIAYKSLKKEIDKYNT